MTRPAAGDGGERMPGFSAPEPPGAVTASALAPPSAPAGTFILPSEPDRASEPVVPAADVSSDTPGYAWAPPVAVAPRPLAGIALWLAIAGLGMSLVVGWAFPVGIGAVLIGVVALRRPGDRRGMAIWAIGLAALSIVYSAAWLTWAATRL